MAYFDGWLLHGHLLLDDWDPEGILSTLPAIATTLGGVLTGHWLRSARSNRNVRRGCSSPAAPACWWA